MKKLFALSLLSLLTACASNLPKTISEAPANSARVEQARADIASVNHQEVRWGGTIASVTNLAKTSEIEIVARNLYKSGRPKDSDNSAGRFIAIVDQFIDPEIYKQDRQVTIHGVISGERDGTIGEHEYKYPVVTADALHMWAEIDEKYEPYPYYDPFFYPWFYYPGYGYPHYRGHGFVHGQLHFNN